MKEAEIIEYAAAKFKELTGADVTAKLLGGPNEIADAVLDIKFGNQEQQFYVEAKNEIREQHMQRLTQKLQRNGFWLLVANYIPSTLKEQLRNAKLNYLEASGNCFIQTNSLYFFINDKKTTETRQPKEGKLWNATGLKFIFALLTDPALTGASQRQIAARAGIALGNVGPLLTEMKNEGYFEKGAPNVLLVDELQLRDRWVELYGAVLRPKLRMGRFKRMYPNDNWQKTQNENFLWGGENAGAILTGYLTPENHTLYTKENKALIMKEQKLIPDPNGNVEVLHQFWPDDLQQIQKHPDAVPALIAYAELAADRDSRNQETAQRIKNNYLN